MHEACLKPYQPKPPPELAGTTLVYRIFAGKLRSQVCACGAQACVAQAGIKAANEGRRLTPDRLCAKA